MNVRNPTKGNIDIYKALDQTKFMPNFGTMQNRGINNSSTIFLSKEAFIDVEKLYMRELLDTKLKKNILQENTYFKKNIVNLLEIKNFMIVDHRYWLFFYNNNSNNNIKNLLGKNNHGWGPTSKSLFTIFFNVKAKYLQSLLELLIDILSPMDIFGKFNHTIGRENDSTKYLKMPKLVLYFFYPDETHQKPLANIHKYIMIILENISDEMIDKIACDCYFHDEDKEIACGQSFTLPINKLMFFSHGGYSESGREQIVSDTQLEAHEKIDELKKKFDGENFYKFKGTEELEILYYQKKYYKYKYKYKTLSKKH
jgi:hypothetical protein